MINTKQRKILALLASVAGALPLFATDVQVVKDFTARVDEYVKMQKSLKSKIPPLLEKATPEQIATHQKALAAAVQEARSGAKQGDVFLSADPYFRRIIASELQRAPHNAARETIKEGNPKNEPPTTPVSLAVNAEYPKAAPVSTVPPILLLRLPQLPETVQYRFVGRDLILHDTEADVIVDYLTKVVP
ncbi:MAG: hypothetical protein HYX72_15390 [Acidobacteria bacterium]|nr:hypothetical protein [Acidobacteriota bacterium]